MLAVSHTKPLHDAVAQMADDLYGGYAPATPFLYNQEVYRQSETALRFYTQGGLAIQKFSVMLFASCFISGTSAASQSLILQ